MLYFSEHGRRASTRVVRNSERSKRASKQKKQLAWGTDSDEMVKMVVFLRPDSHYIHLGAKYRSDPTEPPFLS